MFLVGVEEVAKSGLGDAGEGFVGGGEHSEGTGTGEEGVDEPAGLEDGDEGGEIGSGNGEVNDGPAGGELGHGVGRDEDVVNDVHNTVGIDVSGVYFGGVDEDVVVVEEPRLLCLQQPWSSRGYWGPWRARNRKQREDLRWRRRASSG